MKIPATASFVLIAVLLSIIDNSTTQLRFQRHQHVNDLAGRKSFPTSTTFPSLVANTTSTVAAANPCSGIGCVEATNVPINIDCAAANGTSYVDVPDMNNYTIICDIDFPAQNIYPFVLAGSFEDCLLQCEKVNQGTESHCAGFVFAPERIESADDCYLKSSLYSPGPATISLVGATLSTSATSILPRATSTASSNALLDTSVTAAVDQVQLRTPRVASSQLLGPSTNSPTAEYVKHAFALPEKLASNVLLPGINIDLITHYPIAGDTGSWSTRSSPMRLTLAQMSGLPHLSRDGGKGGCINGTNVFIFCDTATFQAGYMNGFVSSSAAIDTTLNGYNGQAIVLLDQIGEWQDNVGRKRGFAPMTTAEEAFNIQLSGQGYRYAVWPESSPIPLNKTHALLYAALVYDEVVMTTQAANLTTLGNTLLIVCVDPIYGPSAQRVVNQLFRQDEVAWGSLGGLRSWGQSGIGGMDGMIYLFGQIDGGVLVARTDPSGIMDRSAYTYWDGTAWSPSMLSSTATSYLFDQPVTDLDIVYSPYHGTFIMVYLSLNADNTFYFRYLQTHTAIAPPHAGGTDDYVSNIVNNEWSSEQVLYRAAAPPVAYIYAGGVHAGYFGDEDITSGGSQMLISWTEHTGQDAASPASGYAHMTAVVTLQ